MLGTTRQGTREGLGGIMAKQSPKVKPKASREAFFVRIDAGDGKAAFFDATEHVGKVMPFSKPQATCAMRVSEGVVAFSLLHMTKKTAQTLGAKPVEIPRGPLARLERRGVQFPDLDLGDIVVEITERIFKPREESTEAVDPAKAEGGLSDLFGGTDATASDLSGLFDEPAAAPKRPPRDEEVKVDVYNLKIRRDQNGVATLEDADDTTLELPRGAARVSVYLKSPTVGRVLAIGFIGHLGKPGNMETVARMAGLVLNSLSHLTEFRLLSGIETVALGASPARQAPTRVRQKDERAVFEVKGYFFTADAQPVAHGSVVAEIDLEHANPTSGRLLCNYTPDKELEASFEAYRGIFDAGVQQALRALLGESLIESITFDIVLGSVDAPAIEALRDAGAQIGGIDCSPTQFRPHQG
jgi:hypothetical protein